MVPTDLVQGQIGPEAKYILKFEGGKLVARLEYDGKLVDGAMEIRLDSDAVLDAAAEAIPGPVDNMAFDLIKAALKSK